MSSAFSLPLGAILNSNSLNPFFAIPAPPKVAGSGVGAGRSPLALPPAQQADPAAVADLVISSLVFDNIQTLRFWCGSWWYWSAGRYTEFASDEVRCVVTRVFSENYDSVRSRHVSDVIEHLKAKLLLNSSLSPPTWLGSSMDWQPADCLPTRDSVVHLPTLVGLEQANVAEPGGEVIVAPADSTAADQPYFVPATPLYFTTVATDFGFDPDAPEPVRWLQFLDELWGDDEQSIDTLQELFGYALTADTRFQKIFCLIGPKRGGKGTIARVLRKLVGEGNVAGPTLSGLATQFGLENIIGKTLAIVSDMRLGQVDRAIVVERLLAISGEDKLTVDRKHKTAVHLQLPTKFLLISNELPRLDDASATIISRMIVLKTTASFYGNEDLELETDLRQELPGILLWAIEGWRRLQERGRFEQPESGQELIAEMKALASPISAFVEECCTTDANDSVLRTELYEAYCDWCFTNGWERKWTSQWFGRGLRAVVPQLSNLRPANQEGSVSYGGLRPSIILALGYDPVPRQSAKAAFIYSSIVIRKTLMIRSKQQSPSRSWGPAWLHKKEFAPPAPKGPDRRPQHDADSPKTFNFVDDHNEQCWQQLSEQDYEYLVGPRNYPSPCPWCGGRLVHSEACHELQASWELVMPFGKYKGRKVSELPDGYKAWLRQQPGLPAELTAAL